MSSIVIRGGTVLDGTGAPGVEADVLIREGRIAEVGSGLSELYLRYTCDYCQEDIPGKT